MIGDDATVPVRRGGRWFDRWEPEDPVFWAGGGRAVARRNLISSIFVEHLMAGIGGANFASSMTNINFFYPEREKLGIVGAAGSLGGVAINLAFRQSYAAGGSAAPAFIGFLVFYAFCAAVTYGVYLRSAEPARAAETAYGEAGA